MEDASSDTDLEFGSDDGDQVNEARIRRRQEVPHSSSPALPSPDPVTPIITGSKGKQAAAGEKRPRNGLSSPPSPVEEAKRRRVAGK